MAPIIDVEDGTKIPALCMEFASTVEAMEGDVDLQSVQNMVIRNVFYYHPSSAHQK